MAACLKSWYRRWSKSSATVVEGEMGFRGWWLMGFAAVSVDLWVSGWWLMGHAWDFFFFFFLWFVVYGFCDQRWARMVVIGLGRVAGFSVGLGMKNSCGQRGYIRNARTGLGFSRSHGAKT